MELLLARNPDPDSSLPYLLRLPIDAGMVFRTKGTWPRTSALYCHPAGLEDWPAEPEIVERVPLRACQRRGAAIDIVRERGREQRSQIVFTQARGREMVFWQAPRTRKQARPAVALPTARAQRLVDLEILVDSHERYPYLFARQQARTQRRALPCGDYAIATDGRMIASVERKSIGDLATSLTSGRLKYALGELAALPRAAVVVEDGYRHVFAHEHVRGALFADGSPNCSSASRRSRSRFVRRASSPRSGPTATSPPRTRGRSRKAWPPGAWASKLRPPARPSPTRARASFGLGPGRVGSRCRRRGGCGPTSLPPGERRENRSPNKRR